MGKTEKVKTLLPLLVTYIVRNYQYDTMLLDQKQEKNMREVLGVKNWPISPRKVDQILEGGRTPTKRSIKINN